MASDVQIYPQALESRRRYHFTANQYERLAEVGILTEDSRVELLDGDLIEMSPIDPRHAGCVNTLNAVLHDLVGKSAILQVQNPIRLNEFSEPQPDLALLRFREDYYTKNHPTPADVLLVIEVANTSLGYDRGENLVYYAVAGIPEVWIVDLLSDTVERYTTPANAAYSEVQKFARGASISSTLLPSVVIKVDTIVGRP